MSHDANFIYVSDDILSLATKVERRSNALIQVERVVVYLGEIVQLPGGFGREIPPIWVRDVVVRVLIVDWIVDWIVVGVRGRDVLAWRDEKVIRV